MRTTPSLLLAATLGLAVVACGDDGADETSGSTTPTTTTTTVPSPSSAQSTATSTTATTSPNTVSLTQDCRSPDGFAISYPTGWGAVADCGQFGPTPIDEPEPATDERAGVISAYVDPVPFDRVSAPTDREQSRMSTTVDDRPTVRTEATTADALYPAGTPIVRWLVDLGSERTLFLTAVDVGDPAVDFERTIEVLDAMAMSIRL